jgi:hypothetical protein
MKKPFLFRYFALLALLLGVSFLLHSLIRQHSGLLWYGDMLPISYLVNFALAFAIVGLLFNFRKKFRQQIGFLFIGGSLLKFAVFFAAFYPVFRADGSISRGEFSSFFVPYLLALILETLFTAKLLRDLEREESP